MQAKCKGQHHCLVVSFFRTEVHFALYKDKSNKGVIITPVADYLINLQASDIFFDIQMVVFKIPFRFVLKILCISTLGLD